MVSKRYLVPLATLGPLGYFLGSGTIGSLVGLVLVWLQSYLSYSVQISILAIALIGGLIVISYASKCFVSPDPKAIILDEVIGCLLAFFALPLTWGSVICCFFLFRFFDISKVGLVGYIERISSRSWTILADDVVAAVLANIGTRLILAGIG